MSVLFTMAVKVFRSFRFLKSELEKTIEKILLRQCRVRSRTFKFTQVNTRVEADKVHITQTKAKFQLELQRANGVPFHSLCSKGLVWRLFLSQPTSAHFNNANDIYSDASCAYYDRLSYEYITVKLKLIFILIISITGTCLYDV